MSFDPLFALLVIVVLALPYLIWLIRADALSLPHLPAHRGSARKGAALGLHCSAACSLAISGIVLLVALNSGWFARNPEEAPIIFRPPVDPLARDFVYCLRDRARRCSGSLISGLFDLDRVVGGSGVALLMSGLAVIVATGDLVHLRRQRLLRSVWAAAVVAPALAVLATTLFLPWTGGGEVATSLPARAIAHFFGDSFERRTNQPLQAVAGDAQLAALISLDPARPHLLSRRGAGTNAVDDAREIQRDRRRRGLARRRHGRHAAARNRASAFPAWCPKCRGRSSGSSPAGSRCCGSAGPSCGRRRRRLARKSPTPAARVRAVFATRKRRFSSTMISAICRHAYSFTTILPKCEPVRR